MSSSSRGRVRVARGLGLGLGLIAAGGVGFAGLAGPAYAGSGHVLHASATTPAPVAPGGSGTLHYTLQNTGSTAVAGELVNVDIPHWVSIPSLRSAKDCKKTGSDPWGGTLLSCAVPGPDGTIAPGQTIVQNVPFTVAASAPGPQPIGNFAATAVPLDASGQPTEDWKDTKGPNTVVVPISTTKNSFDYSVTATKAAGKVGDTVTVTATGHNSGPADMYGADVTIVAPTGTTLTNLPTGCKWVTTGSKVDCDLPTTIVPAGKTTTLDLKFKINSASVGSNGSASVSTKTVGDTNPKDDAAPIDITVTGGSGAGDGTPTLPVTGTDTALIAGTGAAVLLAGAGLVVFGRRRHRAAHGRR